MPWISSCFVLVLLTTIVVMTMTVVAQEDSNSNIAFVLLKDADNMTLSWNRVLDGPNITMTLTFKSSMYGAIGLAHHGMSGLIIACIPVLGVLPSCLTYLGPPANGVLPLASTQISSLISSRITEDLRAEMTFSVLAKVWGVVNESEAQRVIFASGPFTVFTGPQYHGHNHQAMHLVLTAPPSDDSSSGQDDSEASQIIGWMATGVTICYFSSTVQIILAVFKSKSAKGLNIHNFAGMMLNCALWVMYGLRSKHAQVWATNGVGFLISLTGLIGFVVFPSVISAETGKSDRYYNLWMLLGSLTIGAGGGGCIAFLLELSLAKRIVGYLAMVANIFMYGAPLTLMAKMIKQEDVSTLSLVTILAGQMTSCLWLTYAVQIKNLYIGIPNGIGVALFLTQFVLYLKFRDSAATASSRRQKEDYQHPEGPEEEEREPLVN